MKILIYVATTNHIATIDREPMKILIYVATTNHIATINREPMKILIRRYNQSYRYNK